MTPPFSLSAMRWMAHKTRSCWVEEPENQGYKFQSEGRRVMSTQDDQMRVESSCLNSRWSRVSSSSSVFFYPDLSGGLYMIHEGEHLCCILIQVLTPRETGHTERSGQMAVYLLAQTNWHIKLIPHAHWGHSSNTRAGLRGQDKGDTAKVTQHCAISDSQVSVSLPTLGGWDWESVVTRTWTQET